MVVSPIMEIDRMQRVLNEVDGSLGEFRFVEAQVQVSKLEGEATISMYLLPVDGRIGR